jgi:hypothetical protein
MLGSAAAADVIQAEYSPLEYHYEILHMPDFDQRRDGLPGNGAMWCGPAAVMNVLAYIANHGFDVRPGTGNWQSQANHELITDELCDLGFDMDTGGGGGCDGADPAVGTGWEGMLTATTAWLDGQPATITLHNASHDGIPPRHSDIAMDAVGGALIVYGIGKYDIIDEIDGLPVVEKTGGHLLTLVAAHTNGDGTATFSLRNPNRHDSVFEQSPFARIDHHIEYMNVRPAGDPNAVQTRSHMFHDEHLKLVTGYMAIKLRTGYSFDEHGLWFWDPFHDDPTITTFEPVEESILDVVAGPDQVQYYVLHGEVQQPRRISRLNPLDGSVEFLMEVPLETQQIVFTRRRELLTLLDYSVGRADIQVSGGDLEIVELGVAVDALTWDDDGDDVWVLSITGRSLTRVPQKLDGPPEQLPFLSNIPLGGTGDVACINGPAGLEFAVCSSASDCVYILQLAENGLEFEFDQVICDADVVNPNGVSFVDDGQLLVSTDGIVAAYAREKIPQGDGTWVMSEFFRVLDSEYAPLGGGYRATTTRSRSSHDPATSEPAMHLAPDDFDMPETIDCPFDFDDDRTVGIVDFLTVLAAWGSDDPVVDVAPPPVGDDMVGILDLLGLLASWGPCPE